jgi:cyclophilin family peptidyl-prolyl cis-trans isomerase
MNGDPQVQAKWKETIKDDPVVTTNTRGTATFATSGPNTRTTQVFINTNANGNAFLDKQGFSPFAEVISGMEVVDRIYDYYREKPDQALIRTRGNEYLKERFPKLSFIVTAAST